ncbi:hypothetical protein COCNU_02G004650 [Cocos nucifera]|uniref:Uncharacterized protein n=1 Tax=Cocos nucifera TaxID=13894 RepID=A0A8K0HYW3_COCNU|nr:hypothetical protein COCNU_02G004650 [Cocos nucifera]
MTQDCGHQKAKDIIIARPRPSYTKLKTKVKIKIKSRSKLRLSYQLQSLDEDQDQAKMKTEIELSTPRLSPLVTKLEEVQVPFFLQMDQALLPKAIHTPTNLPSTTVTNSSNTSSAASPSTLALLIRLVAFLSLAVVSMWANYEASKGFEITILSADTHTATGRRFNLMFVSNGRAARLILSSSDFIERMLYPSELYPRKPVRRITLQLAVQNFAESVSVRPGRLPGDFVILVSPSVMAETNVHISVASAVQRGMAQVWLWNGQGGAPRSLLDSMAEYLTMPARPRHHSKHKDFSITTNTSCWDDRSDIDVARFLQYCEERRHGFVARLNRAMQGQWDENMVDYALGSPSRELCLAYLLLLRHEGDPSGPASVFDLKQAM